MPSPKLTLKLRILQKQLSSRVTLEQANELRHRTIRMQPNEDVHVISTNLQSMHLATSSRRGLPQGFLATPFNLCIEKYAMPVLGHKHNMECTLAIAMAERLQTHVVTPPRR